MSFLVRVAVMGVVALFAGCLGTAPGVGPLDVEGTYPIGVHPYPVPFGATDKDGNLLDPKAWPTELRPPFKLKELLELRIPSFDGTELQMWVLLPDLPEGVLAPAVVKGSPYYGQNVHGFNGHTGDDPDYWDNSAPREAVPVNLLIENGYAVVLEAIRGTSNSQGCFDFFGPMEQQDQAHVVEWAAAQPWSNGRVGMMGLSYHGTTPIEAAILNPPHLKTIVVSGVVTDLYDFLMQSPQGNGQAIGGPFGIAYTHWQSLSPPVTAPTKGDAQYGAESWIVNGNILSRACPETLDIINTFTTSLLTPSRAEDFALERRLIDSMPGITASMFIAHGMRDGAGPYAHNNADRDVWSSMPDTPKRKLSGQWGHMFPNFADFDGQPSVPDWNDRLLEWLDFWLKGIGSLPPGEGTVDYQDTAGAWHASTAWPPAEVRNEVLYLVDGTLSPVPGSGGSSFRAAPGGGGLCFVSEPATTDMVIAGNPIAYLRLISDLPGGRIDVSMHDVDPDGGCNADGTIYGATKPLFGAADLMYHKGNYDMEPFAIDNPTNVRVDMSDQAFPIETGGRLGIVITYPVDSVGYPIYPTLEVSADGAEMASHVVVPVVSGTFGASTPTVEYPVRPHIPAVGNYRYE